MLLQTDSTVTNTTNLKSESYTINADNVIFEVLSSSLYTDKELAVLREYSANAYDAHLAAGIPERPIEITLPTEFEPNLVFTDFGVGLSLNDIIEYFCRYSGSSKRNDSEAIGCYGLGSKSAFSLVEAFTVTSVNNGTKSVVICYLDNGTPNYTIVSSQPTTEPSGTTITIPVADTDKHRRIIRTINNGLFNYWEVPPVFTNGTGVVNIKTVSLTLFNSNAWAEETYISYNNWATLLDYVILGNFKYKVPSQLAELVKQQIENSNYQELFLKYRKLFEGSYVNGYNFKLPVSALKVAPSRERLEVNKHNAEVLTKLLAETVQEAINKYEPIQLLVKEELANLYLDYSKAKTYLDFSKVHDGINQLSSLYGLFFKAAIPTELSNFVSRSLQNYVYLIVDSKGISHHEARSFILRNRIISSAESIRHLLSRLDDNCTTYVTTAKPAKVSAYLNSNNRVVEFNSQTVNYNELYAVEESDLQVILTLEFTNLVVIPAEVFKATAKRSSTTKSVAVRDKPIFSVLANSTSVALPYELNYKEIYSLTFDPKVEIFVVDKGDDPSYVNTYLSRVNIDNKPVLVLQTYNNQEFNSVRYKKFAESHNIQRAATSRSVLWDIGEYVLADYTKQITVLNTLGDRFYNNYKTRYYVWKHLPESYKQFVLRFKQNRHKSFEMFYYATSLDAGTMISRTISTDLSSFNRQSCNLINQMCSNFKEQAHYLYRNCPDLFNCIPNFITELETIYDSLHRNP